MCVLQSTAGLGTEKVLHVHNEEEEDASPVKDHEGVALAFGREMRSEAHPQDVVLDVSRAFDLQFEQFVRLLHRGSNYRLFVTRYQGTVAIFQ